ncbi:hypothetical protein ACFPN0_02625 [Kitasatospora cinereorecta]
MIWISAARPGRTHDITAAATTSSPTCARPASAPRPTSASSASPTTR